MALIDKLKAIGDAIREKNGTTALIPLADIPQAILDIESSENSGLAIAYGEAPPEDTSKLWIKANEPAKVGTCLNFAGEEKRSCAIGKLSESNWIINSVAAVGNKIYILGGSNKTLGILDEIQCFDTQTNQIETVGQLPQGVNGGCACSVGEKIYLFGGYGLISKDWLNTVYCYDTQTKTIETIECGMVKREFHTCAVVGSRVYLFGGSGSGTRKSDVEIFDTTTNTVNKLGVSCDLGEGCNCVVMGNHIYLGYGYHGKYDGSILRFDTDLNTIKGTGLSHKTGQKYGMVAIGTKIYFIGGYYSSPKNYFQCVDVSTGETTDLDNLYTPTEGCGCISIGNKIYIIGGNTPNSQSDTIDCYEFVYPLNSGELLLVSNFNGKEFEILSSDGVSIKMSLNGVYIGNENNQAQFVEACLHNGTHWQQI